MANLILPKELTVKETDVILIRVGKDFDESSIERVAQETKALIIILRPGESLKKLKPQEARRLYTMLDRKLNG